VRPAVEAGEKLGFPPGESDAEGRSYLRPLYDALYEMLGIDKVTRLIERNASRSRRSPICADAR
jgi:phosphate starvation-inducible PhoH-like protein